MMGTGAFAVPAFRTLCQSRHEVVALVTSPLRARQGKEAPPVGPMRPVAEELGVPIFDPEDVNAPAAVDRLGGYKADLLVVCDYGQILRAATLEAARLGGVNIHGSLLPKYRGAAPVNWAIYHGEEETGVTVIHITPKVDAGPSIARAETPIGHDETTVEVESRLAALGASLLLGAIDGVESGNAVPLAQDPTQASKAPRLKKTDGAVDWSRSAEDIRNQVRAFEPWPRTFTLWRRADGPPMRLIFGPVDVVAVERAGPVEPGTVLEVGEGRLVVAAGRDAVSPREIQPAGKRMLSTREFLHGYHLAPGDRLGPE
jgi:methionyl-tRNA formyltransferase